MFDILFGLFLSLIMIYLLYFRDSSLYFLINIDLLNSFINNSIFIDINDDFLSLSWDTLFIVGLLCVDKVEYFLKFFVLLMDSFD